MHAHSTATCRGAMKDHSKRGFTKLRFKKSYSAVNDTTKKIVEVKRGFIGAAGDKKYIDIAKSNYANDTTGSITHFSPIPQGTTVVTRLGKSFRPTSVQLRGLITPNATATSNKYANYLVWDNQPDKALAAITDVFQSVDASSLVNRDNASRFRILRKWTGIMIGNIIVQGGAENALVNIDEFIKLPKDCVVTQTAADTTGVITNCITGALLFITMGNAAAGTAAATTSLVARINFSDE